MSASSQTGVPVIISPSIVPRSTLVAMLILIALGAITMIWGLASNPVRAWQAYLVNFNFFLAIGVGGTLFSCVIYMASGRWGRNVKRVADAMGVFLPVSVVLFVVMIPGLKYVIPWFTHPFALTTEWQKWWMDPSFMIARDLIGLVILAVLGWMVLCRTLRVDIGHANHDLGGSFNGPIHKLLTRGWRGTEAEVERSRKIVSIVSPIYGICFAWILTLLSMDLIMSLKEHFYSTLVGGYYFAGSFFIALAVMMIGVVYARRRFALDGAIQTKHLHDIAKLCMAFGVVNADFFYGQLMVIWYGNIPHETAYIIERAYHTPYKIMGYALIACFGITILMMIKQSFKEKDGPMIAFAAFVMAYMWMARLFEVAPSITGTESISFGVMEVGVTLGFLGLVGLVFTTFLHRVPPVVLRDPVLDRVEES